MRILDLFAGIGGFSLGLHRASKEFKTVAFCEMDPFCTQILNKHWPDVPVYPDIRKLNGKELGTIELISAGFPCPHFPEPESGEDLKKTTCSLKLSESPNNSTQDGSCLKMSRDLNRGERLCKPRSKILGMSGPTLSWMQEILGSLKCVSVTLRCVFEEESCLIHNIYGGFKESKLRIFSEHAPTLRTPKGGGHLPSVLKRNGELLQLTPEEAERIMGFPIGWTVLDL